MTRVLAAVALVVALDAFVGAGARPLAAGVRQTAPADAAPPVTPAAVASAPSPPARTDLDTLMARVVQRRDDNWKKLQQYVLGERQAIDVRGPGNVRLWGDRREFLWYLRDGYFVQSPVSANGVTIAEADRRKYEDDYLKRAKARDARPMRGGAGAPATPSTGSPSGAPPEVASLIGESRRPEFIDSAYFLRFKFEEGKYALVGRETFAGRSVLRVEYYPAHLFDHEQGAQGRRQAAGQSNEKRDEDATLEQLMNKVSLVTLWVDPEDAQIVKYTFDNIDLGFLPASWLVRVNDLRASMTMSQPFPNIWLPDTVDMSFGAMVASGSFTVGYHVDYHDYREATTSGRVLTPATR